MGNIRPTYIKRVAFELMDKHGEKFTEDFDTNKQVIDEVADIQGKTMRNRVAGYVTRLHKRQQTI